MQLNNSSCLLASYPLCGNTSLVLLVRLMELVHFKCEFWFQKCNFHWYNEWPLSCVMANWGQMLMLCTFFQQNMKMDFSRNFTCKENSSWVQHGDVWVLSTHVPWPMGSMNCWTDGHRWEIATHLSLLCPQAKLSLFITSFNESKLSCNMHKITLVGRNGWSSVNHFHFTQQWVNIKMLS